MEKIRILFLITDLGKGGAERFLIDYCNELLLRDEVEFIIGTLYQNNEYKHITTNLPIVNLNYTPFQLRKQNKCPEYKKLLDDFSPNVVHTHRFLAEFLSSYYLNPKIKYVCHGHDNMIQLRRPGIKSFFIKRLFLNMLERRVLMHRKYKKVVTHFIANSEHTLNYYKNALPSSSKHQVHLIQYGFNFNRFYNEEDKTIRQEKPIRIINIGSFQPKKNQKFILEVAKILNKSSFKFEFHLLGDGALKSDVEALVESNNLSENFVFHGNVDNVEEHLHKSHIYLHTAWYEPFGLVFLEAMAAGLPVVTMNGKGNRDIIEHGKNGFIFNRYDANDFAHAILKLSSDNKLFHQITAYSKLFAREFDMEKKVQEFINLYKL